MSEERRQIHPQEPAEGAEENEETPGAEKSGNRKSAKSPSAEERSGSHPQEPAEGFEEDVEAPGVQESRDDMGERKESGKNGRSSAA